MDLEICRKGHGLDLFEENTLQGVCRAGSRSPSLQGETPCNHSTDSSCAVSACSALVSACHLLHRITRVEFRLSVAPTKVLYDLYRLIAELVQHFGDYGVHCGDGRSLCGTVLSGR